MEAPGKVSAVPSGLPRGAGCRLVCRECGGSSEYEVADHLIKPMGCEHFILLVIAVVVVVIEGIVSGGWVLDPVRVASASY